MHLSPNMSDDGHDTGLAYGVSWAKEFLTPLLLDDYFMNRTLILLTLDESATYSEPNKVASLLLGDIPSSLKGTTDNTFYSHYSILSTIENNFGLPNLGRYDVGANVFELVANSTGYQNQIIADIATVYLNQSYSGFLNSNKKLPVPTPNVELVGSGGQGVLVTVADTWVNGTGCNSFSTPYNGSGLVYDSTSPPVYSKVQRGMGPSGTATGCATSGQASSQSSGFEKSWDSFSLLLLLGTVSMMWLIVISH